MGFWNLKTKSVLIVDDFPQMRSMLLAMLKNYEPKDVQQAGNGKEAIEKMENNRFDIVFCDYNLGDGQDGQQVLEEAKERKLLPYSTLFIMVTAENTNAMVMGAAEYMPDDYLAKPINKTVLMARLQKLLLKKQSLQALSDAMQNNDAVKTIKCCDELLAKDVKFKSEVLKIKSEFLLKLGRFDEALALAQDVIKERKLPWAMMVVGQVLLHNKDMHNAEMQFRDVISADKNFMPAYDCLAEVMKLNENYEEAQNVLLSAIKISPKSILRQRTLADVLDVNNENELLEKARKKVVDIGRSSCLKKSSDYTKLAKVYVTNGSANKAIEVLNETGKMFRGDDQVVLDSKVQLANVYKSTDNKGMYKETIEASLKLAEKDKSLARGDTAMELAAACMELGKVDQAKDLISSVVKEYSDDPALMNKVNQIYVDAGMAEEGEKLIAAAKAEVIKVNNEGVSLIKEGKISDAINLFQVAVREMPKNITINMNIATALYLAMKSGGFNQRVQEQIMDHLNNVFEREPHNAKAIDLRSKCLSISK